jgi:DNA-binding transcriptional ArsR family regulator
LYHVPTNGSCSRFTKLTARTYIRNFHALDMQPKGCIISLMDAVFKALADPSRRKLLDELRKENGQTLSELCEHLDMTRQAVTKHLVLLEKANLIAVVWRGREKLHYLNPMPLHEIYERWIGKYERHRLQALSDLKKGLEFATGRIRRGGQTKTKKPNQMTRRTSRRALK